MDLIVCEWNVKKCETTIQIIVFVHGLEHNHELFIEEPLVFFVA